MVRSSLLLCAVLTGLCSISAALSHAVSLDDFPFGLAARGGAAEEAASLKPRAEGLLETSATVHSPLHNSTFRFDGHLFNFTYDGIAGRNYHTTGVQMQFATMGLGEGVRASGVPSTFNGFARTTQQTVANIFPNAYQEGTTDYERAKTLFNRYEYTLQAPKIKEWHRDLAGYLVVIEFYTTPYDQDMVWTNVLKWPLQLVSSTPV